MEPENILRTREMKITLEMEDGIAPVYGGVGGRTISSGHQAFVYIILSAIVFMVSCGNSFTSDSGSINPRDTVVVPEYYTGEDSIAYIENAILQSPILSEDLLGLAEVHSVEDRLFNYNNFENAKEFPEYAEKFFPNHRDSAAMRLANRFMRMANLVNLNGNAKDKLQWAVAVNVALDTLCREEPTVPTDSAIYEIERVINKFSSLSQSEMNFQCYVDATIDYYRTIEAYRRWIASVPPHLKQLVQEEYEAWHNLNDARFEFWRDVSYTQEWYSAKPMEIEGYYESLSSNRRAELEIERDVILNGKSYNQKGVTVTSELWEQWILEHSVPEDIDLLKEVGREDEIPSDSIVSDYVNTLRTSFTRWLSARQAIAAALPKKQGKYYDNITADIHSRLVGKLDDVIPLEKW